MATKPSAKPRNWYFKYYGVWLSNDLPIFQDKYPNNEMFTPADYKHLKTLHWVCKEKKKHFERLEKIAYAKRDNKEYYEVEDRNKPGEMKQFKIEPTKNYHTQEAMDLWHFGIKGKDEEGDTIKVTPYVQQFEMIMEMWEAQKQYEHTLPPRNAKPRNAKREAAEILAEQKTEKIVEEIKEKETTDGMLKKSQAGDRFGAKTGTSILDRLSKI